MMIYRNPEIPNNPGKMHGSSLGGLPGGNKVRKFEREEISEKVKRSNISSEGTTTEPAIEVTKTKFGLANQKLKNQQYSSHQT